MEITIYKTPRKFCYNTPIRLSQEDKFSPIVGNDITKIMKNVFITTIDRFYIGLRLGDLADHLSAS